jgi:hypothetical protein
MEERVLSERGRTLEEEFFRKEEAKILERMRAAKRAALTREELRRATGIADEAALDRLAALGLSSATLSALALVPLVEVAWATGGVDANERKAVLQAAADSGLDAAGQDLLASWLSHAPDRALLEAWKSYVSTIARELTVPQRELLKSELLGRARKVAASSGGVLGLGKISKQEEAVLKELAQAFA